MPLLPRTPSPSRFADALANMIDAWHGAHPDLTVREILQAIEEIRFKLTEGLLRAPTAGQE